MSVFRSPWFAAGLHAAFFGVTWLTAAAQPQPLLDGPARWGVYILFVIDLPVSAVGFSLMWDKKLVLGLLVWGIIGTAWWYLLGLWLRRRSRASTSL